MIKPYFYYCIWKSHTIFRHDNHLLMAKYGLGCQAQAFQSILERGRCSARSTAFHLSGELWNTSPTYRCRNQYNTTIKEWMSDAGGEYKSDAFLRTLKDDGITVLQSVPYVSQQNGRAERFMRTIMDKAQAMRLEACLPQNQWEFAVAHATHCYNRTPMNRLKWHTPYELLNNEIPDISHLRVFGCGAYVHIPEARRLNKLSPKS